MCASLASNRNQVSKWFMRIRHHPYLEYSLLQDTEVLTFHRVVLPTSVRYHRVQGGRTVVRTSWPLKTWRVNSFQYLKHCGNWYAFFTSNSIFGLSLDFKYRVVLVMREQQNFRLKENFCRIRNENNKQISNNVFVLSRFKFCYVRRRGGF